MRSFTRRPAQTYRAAVTATATTRLEQVCLVVRLLVIDNLNLLACYSQSYCSQLRKYFLVTGSSTFCFGLVGQPLCIFVFQPCAYATMIGLATTVTRTFAHPECKKLQTHFCDGNLQIIASYLYV